jgi:hypothetical protein
MEVGDTAKRVAASSAGVATDRAGGRREDRDKDAPPA